MFPLGLVTMLFFVLFDCGCIENTTVLLQKERERDSDNHRLGTSTCLEIVIAWKTQPDVDVFLIKLTLV